MSCALHERKLNWPHSEHYTYFIQINWSYFLQMNRLTAGIHNVPNIVLLSVQWWVQWFATALASVWLDVKAFHLLHDSILFFWYLDPAIHTSELYIVLLTFYVTVMQYGTTGFSHISLLLPSRSHPNLYNKILYQGIHINTSKLDSNRICITLKTNSQYLFLTSVFLHTPPFIIIRGMF